jgi:hypothetical protein
MSGSNELYETDYDAYTDAIGVASKETGLPVERFPQRCPYSLEQILSDHFFPGKHG